jgi:phosphatidylinositol alpha-1,6-mannosyltransferase
MLGAVSENAASGEEPRLPEDLCLQRARAPRLLVLTADFPPQHGGIQVLVHRLAAAMDGFETRVVALRTPGALSFDAHSGLHTRRAAALGRSNAAGVLSLNAVSLREAVRFRPQVTLSAHVVVSPAAAGIRRVLGAPVVQYAYANEIVGKPRLSAFAARSADVVIAISSYTAELIAATGARPADLRVIPPGVDAPVDTARLRSERPTILTVARLRDAYKGHDVLVDALAIVRERVPDVQWVVVGDGPRRGELEGLVRSRGLADCTSFLGAVADEERDSWLRRADVFAMPSRLPGGGIAGEGFGIVFLEAAAYGVPVVAGAVGGALDAVSDGESGLLVDPADAVAVATAITRLLLDGDLRKRLGEHAARWASEFLWPSIAARVQSVLLEQVGSGE